MIPVFIDESEDADHVLSQSAFEPVWQVLKALRAHDRRLADELDQLRLSLGRRSKSGGRINLPANIHLDVPQLLLRDFEQAFYVRTVEQTTDKPVLTIEQILVWADKHKAKTGKWPNEDSGQVVETDETWSGIAAALRVGSRGLPRGSSLAKLLAEYREKRNKGDLPPLTVNQILAWADAHEAETGALPNRHSGQVTDTDETWNNIDVSLRLGLRDLISGSSLAKLLAKHRGRRNKKNLSPLSANQILAWADTHEAATGAFPKWNSGQVTGTDETWANIDASLNAGTRGFAGGSTLAKLLAEHRGVRNHMDIPPLIVNQILAWVNAHKTATGDWPNLKSGQVTGTDETWARIDRSLRAGVRGLPGGSSLAQLLAEHRNVRNTMELSPLTVEQILAWADAFEATTGALPNRNSGQVTDTDETWSTINAALSRGKRGLPIGSSLAKLLDKHRGRRNKKDLPSLTVEQILAWADQHKEATGALPKQYSGQVTGTDETWGAIHNALYGGGRGQPGGSSLAKLLTEHRAHRNKLDLPPLTVEQILSWADAQEAATGTLPNRDSGQVPGTGETWGAIHTALSRGGRGLPGGSSLAKLLAEHHRMRTRDGIA